MDEGMVKIILAVITLLSAIITGVVVPYIKSKTTAEQRNNAYETIKILVAGAEQILKIEDPTGAKRKAYVIEQLEKINIKLDEATLDLFIEAAVNELNRTQQELLR